MKLVTGTGMPQTSRILSITNRHSDPEPLVSLAINWNYAHDDAETHLRVRPLREQWEARGPGMLAHISRRAPWIRFQGDFIVDLVNPGSGGIARVLSSSRVEFVAFLANPLMTLPEVVRLAWLCTCAKALSTRFHPAELALIPVALEAADYVELTRFDAETLQLAMGHWHPNPSPMKESTLLQWWRQLGSAAIETKEAWLHETAKLGSL